MTRRRLAARRRAPRPMCTVTHTDDYVAFCEGVRQLCGVDLLQYKRGQMERRIRTFAERRGDADLAAYPDAAAGATRRSSTRSSTA